MNCVAFKHLLLTAVALLVLYCLDGCKSKPTESTPVETKISGRITEKGSSSAISGAQVITSPITSSVTSDVNGSFTISDVKQGSYAVTATKDGYKSGSVNVKVTEGSTASADMQLEIIKAELTTSVGALDFGTSQTNSTFSISNGTAVGSISWSIASGAAWVTVSPTSGTVTTGSSTITVAVNRTGLAFGNYSTNLSIASNAGNKDIVVTCAVANPNAPQLTVTPVLLDFGSSMTQLSVTIRNTGTGRLDWSASAAQPWIAISPAQDSTRTEVDQLTVNVNRSSLTPGTYSGDVTITSNSGAQSVAVKMVVPSVPSLALSTQLLDYDSTKSMLSFIVSNAGTGDLTWNASGNQTWMTVNPTSGLNTGTVNVSVAKSGMAPGDFSGAVAVTSNGGNANVNVIFHVSPPRPPSPVTVTPGAVSTNSVALSWTSASGGDFAAYKIYYGTSPAITEGSTLAKTIIDVATTSFTVTALQPNTTYYFRVFVMNSQSLSAGSNTVSGTTDKVVATWRLVGTPAGFKPNSVHYISENNIWVGGSVVVSGYDVVRIYQFDGSHWNTARMQASDTVGVIEGIGFLASGEGLAISNKGIIYRYDGSSWQKWSHTLNTSPSRWNICATSSTVWFWNGWYSQIMSWDGQNWVSISMNGSLMDLTFSSAGHGYATTNGSAYIYDGSTWILTTIPSNAYSGTLYSMSGPDLTDLWACDYRYLYHFDGTNWQRLNDIGGNGQNFSAQLVRMLDSKDGWLSSESRGMSHYDGTSWTVKNPLYLDPIWDFGNGNLWGLNYNSGLSTYTLYRLQ